MKTKDTMKITNTAARDPNVIILEAEVAGLDTTVKRMEARGQEELVNSSVLPTKGLAGEHWKTMGVIVGDLVDGDAVFTNVTLPRGWSKQATAHAMWSNLVDDKGRVRAVMFYKAAFYDRSANITTVTRFTIYRNYDRDRVFVIQVMEGDKVLFRSTETNLNDPDGKILPFEDRERAELFAVAECFRWLTENGYSDYKNPAAYWD